MSLVALRHSRNLADGRGNHSLIRKWWSKSSTYPINGRYQVKYRCVLAGFVVVERKADITTVGINVEGIEQIVFAFFLVLYGILVVNHEYIFSLDSLHLTSSKVS